MRLCGPRFKSTTRTAIQICTKEKERPTFNDNIKDLLLESDDDIETAICGIVLPPLRRVLDAEVPLEHRQYPIALIPASDTKVQEQGFANEGEEGGIIVQVGIFAAEFVVHGLVGGAEVVYVGFPQRRAGELDVRPRPVGRHVEPVPLQQRVGLHAPVLVRGAHHRVPKLRPHLSLSLSLYPLAPLSLYWGFRWSPSC